MTRQSLQALRRTITVDWRNKAEQDAKALLIKVAKEGTAQIVAEQTARAGVKPGVQTYANQEGNRNLDSVKLPGPIVSNFTYFEEIVEVTMKALIEASPRDSGEYIAGHTLYVNGHPAERVPSVISTVDDVFIANRVPYARRIEIGRTKAGRPFVIQVQPRIYERVAKQIIMPKYRTVAKIAFTYADLPDAYVTRGGLGPTYLREGSHVGMGPHRAVTVKRRQKPGQRIRYPAITIGPIA